MPIAVNGLNIIFFNTFIKQSVRRDSLQSFTRLALPHFHNNIHSLPVTRLLSKALLSAEPAVSDAVGIANPSVWWVWWCIRIPIP